jgi:hypothetical protein
LKLKKPPKKKKKKTSEVMVLFLIYRFCHKKPQAGIGHFTKVADPDPERIFNQLPEPDTDPGIKNFPLILQEIMKNILKNENFSQFTSFSSFREKNSTSSTVQNSIKQYKNRRF